MPNVSSCRIALRLFILSLVMLLTGCPDSGSSLQTVTVADPGRVILGGRLLGGPYQVETSTTEISVNGLHAVSYATPSPPEPMVYDENAGNLTAFHLVDLARRTYLQENGGVAGVQAAVARIEAHPAASAVEVVDVPPSAEIRISDKTGFVASFRTLAPDTAGRKATEAERAGYAEETAALWRAHLAVGGGLVISSTGNVQIIPATEIGYLLTATNQAFSITGDVRRTALLQLYGDGTIVDDLLANYVPREILPGAAAAPRSSALASDTGDRRMRHAAAPGPAGCCKTPGTPQAWVYRTLAGNDSTPYVQALLKEGYRVNSFDFHGRNQPPGSGWEAFTRTSGSGALYFVTHSSAAGISLQSFAREADASTALGRLQARYDAGDISWWQESNGTWWLRVTPQGIRNHWQSRDTIVHAASCYSITLAEFFAAREYFGYTATTNTPIARAHSDKLWNRLTGEDPGDGSLRQAAAAYDGGAGYQPSLWLYGIFGSMTAADWIHDTTWDSTADPDGSIWALAAGAESHEVTTFAHRDGSPNGDTVLSPAVVYTTSPEPLYVGTEGAVIVGFDAEMDNGISPGLAIDVAGCAEPAMQPSWQFGSILNLPVRATVPGTATVTVRARHARSPAPIYLDGNQSKATGVVPNRDNYVFTFTCLASEGPPGATLFFNLSYAAGSGGQIQGTAAQSVMEGGGGTQVTAVADTGYRFVSWSDGVQTAARTDRNVRADLAVTATFEPLPAENPVQISLGFPTTCVTHGVGQSLIQWLFQSSIAGLVNLTQANVTMRVTRPDGSTVQVTAPIGELLKVKMMLDIFSYGSYQWVIVGVEVQGAQVAFSGATSGAVSVGSAEQNAGQCVP